MTNYTIHVSISIDHEKDPIEFNFLSEKLNWSNLVTLIQSTTTDIDVPVILYYKKENGSVGSLENQEQLEALLGHDVKGLRFFGQKDLVNQTVFVIPGNAFVHLGQLVDQHKQVVSSSRRLARLVGILASFIAHDAEKNDFDYEFKVLEKLIERKINKQSLRRQQNDETAEDEERDVEEEQDPREALFGQGGPFGRGGYFGGRGRNHHHGRGGGKDFFGCGGPCGEVFGGRGRHHGKEFGGRGYHHDRSEEFVGRGGRGRRHHYGEFGVHPPHHSPFGRHGGPSFGEGFGRHHGEYFAGRGGHYPGGKGFFGRFPFGFGEEFGSRPFGKKHGFKSFSGDEKLGRCGGGRHHRRDGFSFSEESSAEDEIYALRMQLLKKHLKFGKGFNLVDNI